MGISAVLSVVAHLVIGGLVVIIVVIVIWGVVASRRGKNPWQAQAEPGPPPPPWSVLGTEAAQDWIRLFDETGGGREPYAAADGDGGQARRGLRTETRCRQLLEQLLGRPFVKVRPKWLTNPETGRALELDCYCEELGLAVEVSGQFHSVYTPFYHGSPEGFAKQLRRDKRKAEVCKERGITLFTVPYWEHGDRMRPFLVRKLRELGYIDRDTTGDPLLDAVRGKADADADLEPELEDALRASMVHQREAMRHASS